MRSPPATDVEHDVEVLPADVLAVGEGDGAVHRTDEPRRVRQPHVEEARLDQDQLVVLTQLQETCGDGKRRTLENDAVRGNRTDMLFL